MEDNDSITWSNNFRGGVRVNESLYVIVQIPLLLISISFAYREYTRYTQNTQDVFPSLFFIAVFFIVIAVISFWLFVTSRSYLGTPRKIGISKTGIHASYIHPKFRIHDEFIPWGRIVIAKPFFFKRIFSLGYRHSSDNEVYFFPITPEVEQKIRKIRPDLGRDKGSNKFY